MKFSLLRPNPIACALAVLLAFPTAFAQQSRPDPREAARQRQEALRRDALRLVELATALHKEIEKSSENVLSLTVVRKAEQVEQLAHDLRERARE